MNNVLAHAAATPPDHSTREIPLTQGKVALVDAADYDWLRKIKWCAARMKDKWYAHAREGQDRKVMSMHRLIMGHPVGRDVDHRDGNGLNNRRSNLRIATTQQNLFNRRGNKNSRSGIKGVDWSFGKWRAAIEINGKKIHLGRFTDKHEAGRAYAKAAAKLHGEFAWNPKKLDERPSPNASTSD